MLGRIQEYAAHDFLENAFRQPRQAAYVLGPERGSLSPALLARCDYTVKIPTSFCVNVAMAGAIVMYDRVKSLAHFQERPLAEGGPSGAGREEQRADRRAGTHGLTEC